MASMDPPVIFNFKTSLEEINIPQHLNNPFGLEIPDIAQIAAGEFQAYLNTSKEEWSQYLKTKKGKMFGVLVIQKQDSTYGYLGAVSGKLPGWAVDNKFTPSVFNHHAGDNFINKGMTELTTIGNQIKASDNPEEIKSLKQKRSKKSVGLQKLLFENYNFLNLTGKKKNVSQIFRDSSQGNPPAASGECAAPKLIQYAIENNLKLIAIAEFWWGASSANQERVHNAYYPACKVKCKPILEFMLEDEDLHKRAQKKI